MCTEYECLRSNVHTNIDCASIYCFPFPFLFCFFLTFSNNVLQIESLEKLYVSYQCVVEFRFGGKRTLVRNVILI